MTYPGLLFFQTVARPCPGSAQPVSDTVNQYNNANKSVSVSKYNANAGVNQNSGTAGTACVAQNINNNSSSARSLLNNNHLVNSNISASEVTSATDNNSQTVPNNRILDYNHFYETNNNTAAATATSTGESQYNFANGHGNNAGTCTDEVSVFNLFLLQHVHFCL